MKKSTAETLVNAYAILLWVEAFFAMIGGLTLLFFGSIMGGMMGGFFTMMLPIADEQLLGNAALFGGVISLLLIIALIILAALAAALILFGRAIWRREPWGRTAGLTASIFSLLLSPLGFVIGAFGIWIFGFDDTVRGLFETGTSARPSTKRSTRRRR